MTPGPLRVVVIGAGWVAGDRHLPAILGDPDAELVGIADRNVDRARAMADTAAGRAGRPVRATDDVDALLAEAPDVVHITTSPWSHADIAIRAFAHGAHVFTEKPMAMDSAEARAMVDAAAAADRLLCVSHNFLFSDAMTRARRILDGTPVDYVAGLQMSAPTRRLPTWFRDLPAGLLFDEIPHMLYTQADLLGGDLELDHVRAEFDADGHPRIVEVLTRGATGRGQVTMNFVSPVSEWHVMASASTAVVGLDLFRDITVDLGPDGEHGSMDIARSSFSAIAGHVAGFARAGTRWVRNRQFWGHDMLIGRFHDAVRHGTAPPVPVDDALGVVALTDALLAELEVAAPST